MGNVIYSAGDTTPTCSPAAHCSGRTLATGGSAAIRYLQDALPAIGSVSVGLAASETLKTFACFECDVLSGNTVIDVQTITVNFNIGSQTGGTPKLKELYCCSVNSSCTNIEVLGQNTTLDLSLASTGLKSPTVDIPTAKSVTPGNKIIFVLVGSNESSMSAWSATLNYSGPPTITISFSNADNCVLNVTLDDATLSAAGTVDVQGALGVTLEDATSSSTIGSEWPLPAPLRALMGVGR